MPNKLYDILRFIMQIVLPALATLIFAIFQIWGLPYSAEIIGTISAVEIFLGTVLKISSINYYKGGKK